MHSKTSYFLIFYTLLVIEATIVQECNKNIPKPVDVRVQDCEIPPCILRKNANTQFELDFLVPNNSNTLTTKVVATVFGISTTYPLPDPNACNGLTNGYCPVDQGELLTYELQMPILADYPSVAISVKFSLLDDTKKAINCFAVKCRIQDES